MAPPINKNRRIKMSDNEEPQVNEKITLTNDKVEKVYEGANTRRTLNDIKAELDNIKAELDTEQPPKEDK
ncbi:hypothetical protein JYT83_00325 [bacterium AH-315-F18]|nr:hypothetical protein [bacterium AH-315-F18]